MAYFGEKYRARLGSAFGGRFQVRLLERDYQGEYTDLLFTGQEGGAGFVHLTDEPLTVTWGRKGADIYTPILASHARAQFWRVGDTDLLGDLRGAPPGSWLMEIYRDPAEVTDPTETGGDWTLYWKGRVKTDVYRGSTMKAPSRLDVEATDGLGDLKEAPYYGVVAGATEYTATGGAMTWGPGGGTDIDENPDIFRYTGRAPLRAHMQRCLNKLPYNLEMSTCANWLPSQGSGNPLAGLWVGSEAFYDDEGDPLRCHEVLKQVCYVMGSHLFQREGRWHVRQRETLEDGQPKTAYTYAEGGIFLGTEQTDGELLYDGSPGTIDAATVQGPSRLRGERSYREARGRASVLYNYGPIPGLAEGGDFQDWVEGGTVVVPDEWTLVAGHTLFNASGFQTTGYQQGTPDIRTSGSQSTGTEGQSEPNYTLHIDSFFHGDLTDSYAVKQRVVEYGQRAELRPETPLPADTNLAFGAAFSPLRGPEDDEGWLHETYWSLRVGSYYLMATEPDTRGEYQNCTWTLESNLNTAAAEHVNFVVHPVDGEHNDDGVPIESDSDFLFVTPPHPTGGAVTLTLYATSDKDNKSGGFLGIGGSRELNTIGFDWDDIRLEIADPDGNVLSGRRTVAASGTEGEKDEVEIFIGEGPTETHPARLTWGETETATGWGRGAGGSQTLEELITSSWVRAQINPLETRQETYRNLSDAAGLMHPGRALRIEDAPSLTDPTALGTGRYHISFLEKDLYAGEDEGEWVRLALPATTISYSDEPVEGDGFDAPATTGIAIDTGIASKIQLAFQALAERLSQKAPLATLSTAVPVGASVTSLLVKQAGMDDLVYTLPGANDTSGRYSAADTVLKEGDPIIAVDAETGIPVRMRMAADEEVGTTSLSVGDPDNVSSAVSVPSGLAIGSGIYFGHRALMQIVRAIEQDIIDLQEAVEAIEAEIADIQTEITNIGTDVTNIDNRVTQLEEDAGSPAPGQGTAGFAGITILTATVPSGSSSVTVDPGVARILTSSNVQLTPLQATSEDWWPVFTGTPTFDLTLSSAAGADRSFAVWVAVDGSETVIEAQNLVVTAVGDTSVSLAWDQVEGVHGYVLHWGTTSGGPYGESLQIPFSAFDDPTAPAWTVEGLTMHTTYYFVVTSYANA